LATQLDDSDLRTRTKECYSPGPIRNGWHYNRHSPTLLTSCSFADRAWVGGEGLIDLSEEPSALSATLPIECDLTSTSCGGRDFEFQMESIEFVLGRPKPRSAYYDLNTRCILHYTYADGTPHQTTVQLLISHCMTIILISKLISILVWQLLVRLASCTMFLGLHCKAKNKFCFIQKPFGLLSRTKPLCLGTVQFTTIQR
jgi:hypothetical protein